MEKYWFVANNGSANWSTAANWYDVPGGPPNGGVVVGVPTINDDAIVDESSGSGTLTIAGTSICYSLNTQYFQGTLAGSGALNIWGINSSSDAINLGGNHIYTGTISFFYGANPGPLSGYLVFNEVIHKGNCVINGNCQWYSYNYTGGSSKISLTGLLTITQGYISTDFMYTGAMSLSNSNLRGVEVTSELHLTGTGTILSVATQTNLNWFVNDIYVTSTLSVAKTLSLSNVVCVNNAVYINGSGNALTTVTFGVTSVNYPYVYVNKLDGTLNIGTSTVKSLEFIQGSTITLSTTSVITIVESQLSLCNSMFVTSTSTIVFPEINENASFNTANKTFLGNLTIQGFNGCTINGDYISTSVSTSAININCASGQGNVYFNGNVQINGNIIINSGPTGLGNYVGVYFNNVIANSMSITEGFVALRNLTLNGPLSFNTVGSLDFYANAIVNIGTFSSTSSTAERSINLNNAIITLNGTGTVWSMANGISQGVLNFIGGNATINVNNKSSALCTLAFGGAFIRNLNIDRSQPQPSIIVQTTFTGLGNGFVNFKDFTILGLNSQHYITFPGTSTGTQTYIYDTFQVGNTGNRTVLQSSSVSTFFYLEKLNSGLVICPNVYIQLGIVYNSNTWYAISGSVDNGSSGWIFGNPRRRLGVGGAG